jgi:hypothetical protein
MIGELIQRLHLPVQVLKQQKQLAQLILLRVWFGVSKMISELIQCLHLLVQVLKQQQKQLA